MSAIEKVPVVVEEAVVQPAAHKATRSPSPSMDDKVINQSPPLKTAPETEVREKQNEIDKGLLEKLVEKLSHEYQLRNTSLSFSIDDQTNSLVVKVVDSVTDKVIRQIPPDEILAIRARIKEVLGALFDKEA